MRIVGYTFNADLWCVGCTLDAVRRGVLNSDMSHPYAVAGLDECGVPTDAVDREWNLAHPAFDIEARDGDSCGGCGGPVGG